MFVASPYHRPFSIKTPRASTAGESGRWSGDRNELSVAPAHRSRARTRGDGARGTRSQHAAEARHELSAVDCVRSARERWRSALPHGASRSVRGRTPSADGSTRQTRFAMQQRAKRLHPSSGSSRFPPRAKACAVRPLLALGFPALLFFAGFACLSACTSSETATASSPTDGGGSNEDGGGAQDGGDPSSRDGGDGGADAGKPLAQQEEKEPNNGKTPTESNPMTLPGVMNGALDPANDVDLFAIAPEPGELWEWTLTPTGAAALAPHLTIFDSDQANNVNPTVVAKTTAGKTATLQHFVLGTGKLIAAVRDARNVPTPTGQGGATYGYALTATKKTPAPISITLPSTIKGKLASLSSIDLYSLTLAASTALDVIIRAERKTAPSTLDSRLSIFSVTTKKSLGTNDNVTGSTDSQLGGTLPAGSYILVVENEGTNDADLSYDIELVPR
jgi:hypothetical protein